MKGEVVRLNVRVFALTAAILFGTLSFILNILSVLTGWAKGFFEMIAPFHPGYSHTVGGAFISAFWMTVYGFVAGFLFSTIYNSILKE